MRLPFYLPIALCGLALATSQSNAEQTSRARLPNGDGRFHLGMTRGALLQIIERERGSIISDRAGFLAVTSADTTVEFEQYVFYKHAGAGEVLWKATFAYRVPSSREDFAKVEERLRHELGEPIDVKNEVDKNGIETSRMLGWADPRVSIRLGCRWPDVQDPLADRMRVTWVDHRLQRAVEAGRKRERGR